VNDSILLVLPARVFSELCRKHEAAEAAAKSKKEQQQVQVHMHTHALRLMQCL
jgi:hypothetical protein